ncbi:MAG TPA: hypothetical protein ENI56_01155 [Candidatus Kaiserbacteria bacterium]|nr:hypothetical protein [Candidatus Kaiserbacteria bacterium]
MEKINDLAGNNLERWGVKTPIPPLWFIGKVCVSGIFLNRNSFRSTKEIPIRLMGYFQEEFLYNLGNGIYIPPTILRTYQVITCIDNREILKRVSTRLAVISPAHFLGYVRVLAKISTRIPYGKFNIIAFASGSIHHTTLMRAEFANGVFAVFVEDAYRLNKWVPGTQVISRSIQLS